MVLCATPCNTHQRVLLGQDSFLSHKKETDVCTLRTEDNNCGLQLGTADSCIILILYYHFYNYKFIYFRILILELLNTCSVIPGLKCWAYVKCVFS